MLTASRTNFQKTTIISHPLRRMRAGVSPFKAPAMVTPRMLVLGDKNVDRAGALGRTDAGAHARERVREMIEVFGAKICARSSENSG